MKLIHLSDLHLGKRVNGFSMMEDQAYILKRILHIVGEEKPEGIIIAGDVYDKSVPSAEAVQLFDDFLVRLSRHDLHIFVISGNHDSAERMAFGASLMEQSGVHIAKAYDGEIAPIELEDVHGAVDIYLLPFIKPSHVKRYYPDDDIASYHDAMRVAIDRMGVDGERRNVLVTHQFITGAMRSDSEDMAVGGLDNVDYQAFECFDYVALGHIHRPQRIGRDTVRYCGTPLKYSFSEVNHKKSLTVVELGEKGDIAIRTIPLRPKRDMREIRGAYMDITDRASYKDTNVDDYMHVTLTDEEDIPDAIGKLRAIYPNIMKLDYDNTRTRMTVHIDGAGDAQHKSPMELFAEFYEKQNNQPMSLDQKDYTMELIKKIWGEAQ